MDSCKTGVRRPHGQKIRVSSQLWLVVAIFLLAVVFVVSDGWTRQPLRIAIEGEYPPFSAVDDQGRLTGFDVDIAMAVCDAMQVSCELVKTPWEGIIERLNKGEFDVIAASMSYTPERAQLVEFTRKYYRTTTSYIARTGSGLEASEKGMRGKRIATQVETVHAKHLADTYGKDIDLTLPKTLEGAFDLLVAGEVDAVLCNSLTGYEFLQSNRGGSFDYVGDPLSEKSLSSTANIAVRKGDTNLRDAIDKALDAILQNGEYDRINRKYFPFSIY